MSYDYSIHYRRFHDGGNDDIAGMKTWLSCYLKDDLPEQKETPILDIGCGFGFALHALKAMGYSKALGVELSADQALVAQRAGLEVKLVEDTLVFLREHEGRFGAILLLDVLEHIPVPEQIEFLCHIKQALKPDGRLILTVPNANSILSARFRYIDFTHHSSFTEHSLFFVLKNAGFRLIEMDNSKGIGRFPSGWWRKKQRGAVRRWLVRFCWLQVFKSELHERENLDEISFELNLKAVAYI